MIIFDKIREFPYILAPLAGYTDSPYRRIAKLYGANLVFTEMINEHTMARFDNKVEALYKYTEDERPIGLQLFGRTPELMTEAAAKAESLGFDIVDINFGCPVRKVCNGGNGAAMHKTLDVAAKVISAAKKGLKKIPLSIKIRSGWEEEAKNYIEFNKVAEDNGAEMITMHPRTRNQMFRGLSNWEDLRILKENSKLFVVGSGDVMTAEDALRMKKETGVDGVMIARGSIGNPFIFKQIAEPGFMPSLKESVELSIKHLDMLYEFKGQRAVFEMRKYYKKYIHGFDGVGDIRKPLMTMEDYDEIRKYLTNIL